MICCLRINLLALNLILPQSRTILLLTAVSNKDISSKTLSFVVRWNSINTDPLPCHETVDCAFAIVGKLRTTFYVSVRACPAVTSVTKHCGAVYRFDNKQLAFHLCAQQFTSAINANRKRNQISHGHLFADISSVRSILVASRGSWL